jgi:hypothetical protein
MGDSGFIISTLFHLPWEKMNGKKISFLFLIFCTPSNQGTEYQGTEHGT